MKELILEVILIFVFGVLMGMLIGFGMSKSRAIKYADTNKIVYEHKNEHYYIIKDNALPVSKETR